MCLRIKGALEYSAGGLDAHTWANSWEKKHSLTRRPSSRPPFCLFSPIRLTSLREEAKAAYFRTRRRRRMPVSWSDSAARSPRFSVDPPTSSWDGLEDNVYSRSRGGGKSPHSARRCKCCGGTAKKSSWCIGGKYAAHTGETRECAVFRTLLSANRMKHKPLEKKYLVLLGLRK